MRLFLFSAATALALTTAGCATSPRADTGTPTPARAPDTTAAPVDTAPRDTVGDTVAIDTPAVSQAPAADRNAPSPRPLLSPRDSVQTTVGGVTLSVNYGRPSVRGRKIFGGLVPFGQVWRTGANEATAFETTADLEIGGVTVPAGRYTLYTLPAPTPAEGAGGDVGGGGAAKGGTWQLIVNKQTGQWGTEYEQSQDLARIPMRVSTLVEPVEQFTVEITPTGENRGTLTLLWDTTAASVDFTVKR